MITWKRCMRENNAMIRSCCSTQTWDNDMANLRIVLKIAYQGPAAYHGRTQKRRNYEIKIFFPPSLPQQCNTQTTRLHKCPHPTGHTRTAKPHASTAGARQQFGALSCDGLVPQGTDTDNADCLRRPLFTMTRHRPTGRTAKRVHLADAKLGPEYGHHFAAGKRHQNRGQKWGTRLLGPPFFLYFLWPFSGRRNRPAARTAEMHTSGGATVHSSPATRALLENNTRRPRTNCTTRVRKKHRPTERTGTFYV